MPFYQTPKPGDLTYITCYGLADNYLDELAAQIGKDPSELDSDTVRKCLTVSLENNIYTQTFYDTAGNPRAVFGLSPSGCVTYVETKDLRPMQRVIWARAYRSLPHTLMLSTGLTPWCYSDARNGKAERLLKWCGFVNMPCKDITINACHFKYYQYIPVAKH